MFRSIIAFFLFFLSLASAKFPCGETNALSLDLGDPSQVQPSNSDSTSQPTSNAGDQKRFQNSNKETIGDTTTTTATKRSIRSQALHPRDDTIFYCDDQTVCSHLGDTFVCLGSNSSFVDSNGGSGNIKNLTYTMQNGQVTTLATTATSLPTPNDPPAITGSKSNNHTSRAERGMKVTAAGVLVAVGAMGVFL